MKIHLQSDIHIEMGPWIGPSVSSHVTICAGDIGLIRNLPQLKKYFDDIKKATDHVIWVLGNHEFYDFDYGRGLEVAHEFAVKEGIHLLDEAIGTQDLVIDGVTFWGSTLWTDLNNADWFVMQKIGHGMNDFQIIGMEDKGEGKGFKAQDSVDINTRTRAKINYDADVIITHHHPLYRKHSRFPLNDITYGFCNTGLEDVIITHHHPLYRKHSRFPLNDITYGFCNTGLEDLIWDSKAKLWVFGHTHDSTYEEINGTKVISNQQGYPRKDWQTGDMTYESSNFDPGLILEI